MSSPILGGPRVGWWFCLLLAGCTPPSPPEDSCGGREPPSVPANACVPDVVAALEALPTVPQPWAVWAPDEPEGVFTFPRYTDATDNSLGYNNHFQGVVRLSSGPFLAVSGSDANTHTAQLFLAHLPSRCGLASWGTNLARTEQSVRPMAPPEDRVLHRWNLDTGRWHAGGLAMLGDVLAVGVDHGAPSARIALFDTSRAPELVDLPSIELAGDRADAVALSRLPDGRALLVVRNDARLDFHLSAAEGLDGFSPQPTGSWIPPDPSLFSDLQNLTLVQQCEGPLFLLGVRNTSTVAPLIAGEDRLYLYRVEDALSTKPQLVAVSERLLDCNGQCNFDAAASAYVTPTGQLHLYGVSHFRTPVGPSNPARVIRGGEF